MFGGVLLALASLVGCQGSANDATVEGAVLVDGELATSGTVVFNPVSGKGTIVSGQIFKDGNYAVGVGRGDLTKPVASSLPSGEYAVTVSIKGGSPGPVADGGPSISGDSLIAAKYSSTTTTDLKYTVKPGKNVIDLQLEGAAPVETSIDATATAAELPADGERVEEAPDAPAAGTPPGEPATDAAPSAEVPESESPAADNTAEEAKP